MIFFIACDSVKRRKKIFWLPIGRMQEVVNETAIYTDDGRALFVFEDADTRSAVDAFVAATGSVNSTWLSDTTTTKITPTVGRAASYNKFMDTLASAIPDQYFLAHVMDFKEHIPASRLPYKEDERAYLFAQHKEYKTILSSDSCHVRAKKMFDNYTLYKSIYNA